MSTLNFLGVAHSEIGSAILKKGEITLYSQKTESRNTNFKSIKYGLTVSHFSYAPIFQGPHFLTKMLESNILYDNLFIDILSF